MTWYTYGTVAVYDPISDTVKENAIGGKFVLVKDGPALPMRDLNGSTITEITSNGSGQSSQFQVEDQPRGLVQFGDVVVTVFANEVAEMAAASAASLAAAQAAAAAAAAAAANAQSAADVAQAVVQAAALRNNQNGDPSAQAVDPIQFVLGTPAQWASSLLVLRPGQPGVSLDVTTNPDTFVFKIGNGVDLWGALPTITGGAATDLDSGDISDSSVIGRQILTSADQPAVLTVLGLSWLKVGNGSPEGVVTGAVGAMYRRLDGGASTVLYVKETGTGTTGWVAFGGATKAAVGLGNVDNTSDANKPVSTAQATAIGGRVKQVFYTGSAWPARPADAPAYGLEWWSTKHAAAAAPAFGASAAVDGDAWYCHPSVA